MTRILVVRRRPDRSKQHRARTQARLQRVRGQRILARCQRSASNIFARELQLMPEGLRDHIKHTQSFLCDLGADAISRTNRQIYEHSFSSKNKAGIVQK
jgi:hypothetical protein